MSDDLAQHLEAWAPLIESGYEVPAAGQVMRLAAAEIRSLRAQVAQDRASIVAWLRAKVTRYPESAGYSYAADAIEHHEDKEPRA